MKTVMIIKLDETNSIPIEFSEFIKVNFNTIIDTDGYDVHKLLEGAINGDIEATQMLEYLIFSTNNRGTPVPFEVTKAILATDETKILVESAFLTSNDIDFITNNLGDNHCILFCVVKDSKILIVNPITKVADVIDSFNRDKFKEIFNRVAYGKQSQESGTKLLN